MLQPSSWSKSNNRTVSVCSSSVCFMFSSATSPWLWHPSDLKPSFHLSFKFCVLQVSRKFKHQGNCCHFIFSLNIHFTLCSDCRSEERCWCPVSSCHIWLRPEPFLFNSILFFLYIFSCQLWLNFTEPTKQFSCHWFECISVSSSNLHFKWFWKAISK